MVELIEKELVYKIVGCTMTVHNTIGHGLREKTYERAMCIELRHENLDVNSQHVYAVYYREQKIDDYIPDLLVDEKVIVECKTAESIIDEHRGQVLNYLKISGIQVGVIINFKHPKLEWERLVLESK